MFLLMTSENGIHSSFQNIVGKLISHTVQKPQSQKTFISRRKFKIKNFKFATVAAFVPPSSTADLHSDGDIEKQNSNHTS
jgi:hypothetical protein